MMIDSLLFQIKEKRYLLIAISSERIQQIDIKGKE